MVQLAQKKTRMVLGTGVQARSYGQRQHCYYTGYVHLGYTYISFSENWKYNGEQRGMETSIKIAKKNVIVHHNKRLFKTGEYNEGVLAGLKKRHQRTDSMSD